MAGESGTPTELDLARARLARSRSQMQQYFRPSAESGRGLSPFMRGVAVRGVQALASGERAGGNGLRLTLAVAALVAMLVTRGRSRGLIAKGRGLGLALSLVLALMRFSRRRGRV